MRRISPHAGAVHAERVEAAAGELQAAEEDAHLLGVVHAVEHHDGGLGACAFPRHETAPERGAFIGHLDELDLR